MRKSIGDWVSCAATGDQSAGVAKAFAAAKNGAFTLVVDCPVHLKIAMDISHILFIDDGTTVEFAGSGKFTVDNVFIPAFVIADSHDIVLNDWDVEYDAALPLDPNTGGYTRNDEFVAGPKPANAFNDLRLTPWLASNRGVVFDKRAGNVTSQWTGLTNACAVFFITGDVSNLRIAGMKLHVPESAGGERFIPVAFSLGANYKGNQTVVAKMPPTSPYLAVPHDLTFSNILLDGTYMGWVGGVQNAVFENIHSKRYGDLQDAAGGTVGGVKKWFAPPHLFYFNYAADGDPALFNRNIKIENVTDEGLRAGKARDLGGSDSISGYADSLKLGCVNCSVDHYQSARPDGFMDVLTSDGLTVSNVTATFDSSFLNNLFPGWRFPSPTYKNVKFDNITLIDTAPVTVQGPIGNANQAANQGVVMQNVHVEFTHWAGQGSLPLPTITGQSTDLTIDYRIKGEATRIVRSRQEPVEVTFKASPDHTSVRSPVLLTWTARDAQNCVASGAWSGALGPSGTRSVNLPRAGNYEFTIACGNGAQTARATLATVVDP